MRIHIYITRDYSADIGVAPHLLLPTLSHWQEQQFPESVIPIDFPRKDFPPSENHSSCELTPEFLIVTCCYSHSL